MNRRFKELVDGKDIAQLQGELVNLKREYMNLRIKQVSPVDGFNPSSIKTCRRNIARIETSITHLKNGGK